MLTNRHYQGKPCRYGHSGIRYLSNKHCVECQTFQSDRYKGRLAPEEQTQELKRFPQSNLAKVRKYKAAKSKRVPKWADLNKIKDFYDNCPSNMVVDHIIPLRGKLVSGLHVHNNLQYLTDTENAAKGNKFVP